MKLVKSSALVKSVLIASFLAIIFTCIILFSGCGKKPTETIPSNSNQNVETPNDNSQNNQNSPGTENSNPESTPPSQPSTPPDSENNNNSENNDDTNSNDNNENNNEENEGANSKDEDGNEGQLPSNPEIETPPETPAEPNTPLEPEQPTEPENPTKPEEPVNPNPPKPPVEEDNNPSDPESPVTPSVPEENYKLEIITYESSFNYLFKDDIITTEIGEGSSFSVVYFEFKLRNNDKLVENAKFLVTCSDETFAIFDKVVYNNSYIKILKAGAFSLTFSCNEYNFSKTINFVVNQK